MEALVERYDKLVAMCPRFTRKGKNNPYTSANGHMFSMISKEGEFGMRFSKEVQEKYIQEFKSGYLISYGATMQGYVVIPDHLWEDMGRLVELLNESYDYVLTLKPK